MNRIKFGLKKIIYLLKAIFVKKINSFNRRDNNVWVFGEWFGTKCDDNVTYFANYVANNNTNIKLYWICKKGIITSNLSNKINILYMDSKESKKIMHNAGVAIMGQGFNDFSTKGYNYFGKAVTINLWHGIPWKKFGHRDVDDFCFIKKLYCKIYDSNLTAKYFLSTSDIHIDTFRKAYNISSEYVIKSGYPRNERLYDECFCEKEKNKLLNYLKLESNTKIIAYLPTFRDKIQYTFSFDELRYNSKFLQILKKYNAVVIQKSHFVNFDRGSSFSSDSKNIYSINGWECQRLLAASDILISDYSGTFFDYLILNRPIIHYLYDYEYYKNDDRGLYFDKGDVVCGDTPMTIDELIESIERNLEKPFLNENLRGDRRDKYLKYESFDNSKKIYTKILSELCD